MLAAQAEPVAWLGWHRLSARGLGGTGLQPVVSVAQACSLRRAALDGDRSAQVEDLCHLLWKRGAACSAAATGGEKAGEGEGGGGGGGGDGGCAC